MFKIVTILQINTIISDFVNENDENLTYME